MTVMLPERTEVTITKPIEVSVLERAADLIEETGWCRGSLAKTERELVMFMDDAPLITDKGFTGYCAVGAIWRAGAEMGLISPAWGQATIRRDALPEAVGLTHSELDEFMQFNDSGRGKDDIVAHLRERAMEKMPV